MGNGAYKSIATNATPCPEVAAQRRCGSGLISISFEPNCTVDYSDLGDGGAYVPNAQGENGVVLYCGSEYMTVVPSDVLKAAGLVGLVLPTEKDPAKDGTITRSPFGDYATYGRSSLFVDFSTAKPNAKHELFRGEPWRKNLTS